MSPTVYKESNSTLPGRSVCWLLKYRVSKIFLVDLAIDELKMEEFGVCVVGATLQFIDLSLFR